MLKNATGFIFPAKIINSFHGPLPSWWGGGVDAIAPRASIIYNAFVSAGDITGWPRSVKSRVEMSTGGIVDESEFKRISKISMEPSDLDLQRAHAQRLSGEYVYLGWLFGHYGHFLTETLSRFWYCLERTAPRRFLVHANYRKFSEFPSHVVKVLKYFGINEGNLTIVREPVNVDVLHCPEQALRCDDSVGSHLRAVYKEISSKFSCKFEGVEKVYVSRKSLLGDQRGFNENEVREIIEGLGFFVISPESLPFEEQLEIYSNCRYLVGPVGSGMHNAAFMPEGGKVLILAPNNFLFKNDCLLAAANGYDLQYFISGNGESAEIKQSRWSVDLDDLKQSINFWMS